MPSYKAGQEIDAYCTKCKLDLAHRIVAEVSGKPIKVECRTCYTTHQYRAPKNGPAAVTASTRASASTTPSVSSGSSASSTTGSTTSTRASRTPKVEEAPLEPPTGARIHPYKITEKFIPDMWIQHKTFGLGLILREIAPNKVEVRFEEATRVLVHGMTE